MSGRRRARPATGVERLELAHALRTPLTALALGLGELDRGDLGPLTEAQREVVRTLVGEVDRLARLVGDGLRTDRLGAHAGPVERSHVRLAAIVERAVAPLEPQAAARDVAVVRTLDAELRARVDAVKISWVVASLVGNALRYSPDHGTVRVDLFRGDGEAVLRVSDAGPGVAADMRQRVFERGGGTALFLAREVVEAHGGRIDVSSAAGGGSAFTIALPVADQDGAVA